jgi:hypothetical protein
MYLWNYGMLGLACRADYGALGALLTTQKKWLDTQAKNRISAALNAETGQAISL